MPNFEQMLGEVIDLATELGNIVVTENFQGETAEATRKKAVEFIQQAQVTATNIDAFGSVYQANVNSIKQFHDTPGIPAMFDDLNEIWYHAGKESFWHGGKSKVVVDMSFDSKGHATEIILQNGNHGKEEGETLAALRAGVAKDFAVEVSNRYWQATDKVAADVKQGSTVLSAMPTVKALEDGTYKGNGAITQSIFDRLNGPFQTSDFNEDSPYSKLKHNGAEDWIRSAGVDKKEAKQESDGGLDDKDKDKKEEAKGNPANNSTRTPTASSPASPTAPRTPSTSRSGSSNPWSIKEVDADDIYDQLRDKFGRPESESATSRDGAYGTGSEKDYGPLSPIKGREYNSGSSPSQDNGYKSPSYDSPDFSTPDYDSGDISTSTSSTLPSYSPGSYSSGSGSSPISTGRTIPSSEFNSMMDRLNSPITTRGATGPAGMPGASGTTTRTGGGAGASLGSTTATPARGNAATSDTGESSAATNRGTKSGGTANAAAGGARPAGMGMMPMGMAGMGGAGARPAGKGDKKADIKNQDGDLYGNDVKSVSPIISAGGKPVGAPQQTKNKEN